IYTGKVPFHEMPDAAVVIAIVIHKRQPTRPGNTLALADAVWDMMVDCWNAEPYSRPTMVDVLARVREFFPGGSSELATCWEDRNLTQIWDDVECSAPIESPRRISGGPPGQESAAGHWLANDVPQAPSGNDMGADTEFNGRESFPFDEPNFRYVEQDQHISTITAAQSKSRIWIQGTEEEEGEFEQASIGLEFFVYAERLIRELS
ncbi:hypothetical protein V5O48_017775, partial [Marasmius crinis-equi]